MLNPSSLEGGWKYAVIASNSASVVQGVPGGRSLLRFLSWRLHKLFEASTKCSSCSVFAASNNNRNHSRCAFVLAGKSSTTEMPFASREQIWDVTALFSREEYLTNPGMSIISPGNSLSRSSSWTRSTAFSWLAKSLARVDLPAAILPHKKISFTEVFISLWYSTT